MRKPIFLKYIKICGPAFGPKQRTFEFLHFEINTKYPEAKTTAPQRPPTAGGTLKNWSQIRKGRVKFLHLSSPWLPYVNIHTHRPTGSGIELRTAGVHPWHADMQEVATLGERLSDVQAVGETGLDFVHGPAREVQFGALRAQLRIAREPGASGGAPLRQGFRTPDARTGRVRTPCRNFSRLHRIARAGAAGPCERLFPLVRRTRLRIAQNACGAARNAPVSALSGDRRQPRAHRGNLRPGGGGERGAGGGVATGNFR